MEDYLPSRFKPSNVDRFLPILRAVLEERQEIRFRPDAVGLNVTTAIARVGDAVLAVTRGLQFYPDIDADRLRKVWLDYRIKFDHLTQEVVIHRYKERGAPTAENLLETTVATDEVNFERTIKAFAWLYGTYHLKGKVTILGVLNEQLKNELISNYNVFINQIGPTEHILV